MPKKLSKKDFQRQDLVDNAIFNMLLEVIPPSKSIEWDMEVIASIREEVEYWIVEHLKFCTDYEFYPYMELKGKKK